MTIQIATGLAQSYKNAIEVSVEDALARIHTRTDCYEVLKDINKVFLDIDGKRLGNLSDEEYQRKYDDTLTAIRSLNTKFALGDSSSREKGIISFRVVFPLMKTSREDNKAFASNLRKDLPLPEGISIDTIPYGNNQKIRMMNSSKDGENRPMRLIQGTPEEFLITHVADAEEFKFRKEVEEHTSAPSQVVEQERLVVICRLIADERWKDYQSCMRLVLALKSCGATHEFIHEQCQRADNYGRRWVDDLIRRWSDKNSPTFATLMYYAKLDNPDGLRELIKVNTEIAIEELMKLDTTGCPDEDLNWCVDGRWLKDLPTDETLAVSSMLGTGKTQQMLRLLRNKSVKRALFVSPRRTFSDHILGEIELVDYRNLTARNKDGQITHNRAIVSIQSLWRRSGGAEDVLILDEIETLLACLSPNTTHGKHYLENIQAFEHLIRTAKRVVCLDAFLSDRTLNMLRALRPSVRILVNPSIPYKRHARVFAEFGAYLTECERRISQGKKVYMFWGGREKGEGFHKLLKVPNRIYTAQSDPDIKKRDLSDVNTHWSSLSVVGGTSAISVGVNYTGTPAFDQVFAQVIPWAGGNGRDTLQSIHRVRDLKDNEMVMFIDPKSNMFVGGGSDMGFAAQEREYGKTTARHLKFLHDIQESATDYCSLPDWLRKVIVWNRNEKVVNARNLRAVCFAYMTRCGITIQLDGAVNPREIERSRCLGFSEVDDIEYEQVEEYERNRSVLTQGQKLELEKYYLMRKVNEGSQEIWEQWLSNSKVIRNAWAIRNLTPTEWVQNGEKCIDLISKDAEKLNVLLTLGIDFKQEWSRKVDELPVPQMEYFNVRKRTDKDDKVQNYRELCRAVKSWAGLNLSLVGQKKGTRDARHMEYSLHYDPVLNPIQQVVRIPLNSAQVFADEISH